MKLADIALPVTMTVAYLILALHLHSKYNKEPANQKLIDTTLFALGGIVLFSLFALILVHQHAV